MRQTQISFTNNKLSYIDCSNELGWAYHLKAIKDEQLEKDVLWISKLIDEYSK